MTKSVIGITVGRKFENYFNWISQEPDVEIIRLSYEEDNFNLVQQCDGIILTGGEDLHPRFYGKPEYIKDYHLHDLNEARDTFEWKVIAYTQEHQIPLLGICRGLQLANAFFGGTLIPDIPSFGKPDHAKFEEGRDRYHSLDVIKNTYLESITGKTHGEVNSAHHQSVDTPASELIVSASSPDGIVEAMERKDRAGKPFLLLVQWHPERMVGESLNEFSVKIKNEFLNSVRGDLKI